MLIPGVRHLSSVIGLWFLRGDYDSRHEGGRADGVRAA